MRILRRAAAVLAAAFLASGCASYDAPVMPPRGLLYSHYTAPLGPDVANDTPVGKRISKHGHSKVTFVWIPLYVFDVTTAFDEGKIGEIARENNITHVAFTNYEVVNITPFYFRFIVHVYGN